MSWISWCLRTLIWRFSTAWYGSVRFTFGGFSTGYSTWYFFSTTSAGVPSDPYRYQNVTRKLYWSLIGRRESSLLRHWTCDTRPNKDPLDLNQHHQRSMGRNYQPNNVCFVVCWGSTDVPLVYSRGADPARAEWKSLMYIFLSMFSVYIFTFVSDLLQLKTIWWNKRTSQIILICIIVWARNELLEKDKWLMPRWYKPTHKSKKIKGYIVHFEILFKSLLITHFTDSIPSILIGRAVL